MPQSLAHRKRKRLVEEEAKKLVLSSWLRDSWRQLTTIAAADTLHFFLDGATSTTRYCQQIAPPPVVAVA